VEIQGVVNLFIFIPRPEKGPPFFGSQTEIFGEPQQKKSKNQKFLIEKKVFSN
jgi:hypothetical protein